MRVRLFFMLLLWTGIYTPNAVYAWVLVPHCPRNIATTSTYFVPQIKNYCSSSLPCPKFLQEVKLQGSGILAANKILRPTGAIEYIGKCTTTIGAAGSCLTPFFSIAADPRYYRMGDIISIPAMRGRQITLPNGRKIIHPGLFIVQDTGGAIKGPNRFDFFTGSTNHLDLSNSFGIRHPETSLSATNQCSNRKQFAVIRRHSYQYQSALANLEATANFIEDTPNLPRPEVAMALHGTS